MKFGGARLKTALCYLNDVEEGGETKMTKLNTTIKPKKGGMLVFQNTISLDNHDKHPLSEHAALPVIKGEKYAVNLWFRECSTQKLYCDFNPDYYKKSLTKSVEKPVSMEITNNDSLITLTDNSELLHNTKEIFKIGQFLNQTECKSLLSKSTSNFNKNKRRDAWVNLNDVPEFKNKLEKLLSIDYSFFENINVVEYIPDMVHTRHFNAYDLTSETGKTFTKVLGQRMITITICLTNNIHMGFPTINIMNELAEGDLLLYKNIYDNSIQRDDELGRVIFSTNEIGYIANIYIREKNKFNKLLMGNDTDQSPKITIDEKLNNISAEANVEVKENYMDTRTYYY